MTRSPRPRSARPRSRPRRSPSSGRPPASRHGHLDLDRSPRRSRARLASPIDVTPSSRERLRVFAPCRQSSTAPGPAVCSPRIMSIARTAAPRVRLSSRPRAPPSPPLRSGLGRSPCGRSGDGGDRHHRSPGPRRLRPCDTARTFGSDTFVLARIASPAASEARARGEARPQPRHPPLGPAVPRAVGGRGDPLRPLRQRSGEATAGGRRFENAAITGTSAALVEIRDLGLARGRFLSREDEPGRPRWRHRADVATRSTRARAPGASGPGGRRLFE